MGDDHKTAPSLLPIAAMADDEPTFETAESGASHTYPQQAGEIRKGSYLMIKGNPCKCVEVSTSKTGKHGHAKAHIVALDIFTGKKMEELCPTSHNLNVPFVKREEYTVMDIQDDDMLSLLTEGGDTKEDLKLPSANEEDEKLAKLIKTDFEEGKTVVVTVQSACGKEKV